MKFEKWDSKSIGEGKIIADVLEAIEFKSRPEIKSNNLVFTSSHSYTKTSSPTRALQDLISEKKLYEIESTFYSLYKNQFPDSESFETLVNILGKRYSIIAYLMFLKNDRRYLPLAPDRFEKNLGLIGSAINLSYQCSWENYMEFMDTMMKIRDFLSEKLNEDVHLLDAHSFVWELNLINAEEVDLKTKATYITVDQDYMQIPLHKNENALPITPEKLEIRHGQNMERGAEAELIALAYEKELMGADNYEKIIHVSKGDASLGYDIESLTGNGEKKHIEVKSAQKKGETLRFFVTLNELKKSLALPNYYFYLVVFEKESSEIFILKSPFTNEDLKDFDQIQLKNNVLLQPRHFFVSVPVKESTKS